MNIVSAMIACTIMSLLCSVGFAAEGLKKSADTFAALTVFFMFTAIVLNAFGPKEERHEACISSQHD